MYLLRFALHRCRPLRAFCLPESFCRGRWAHFFLKGDRLTFLKIVGLVLAFTGIFVVFGRRPITAKAEMFYGDILQIAAGVLWGRQRFTSRSIWQKRLNHQYVSLPAFLFDSHPPCSEHHPRTEVDLQG